MCGPDSISVLNIWHCNHEAMWADNAASNPHRQRRSCNVDNSTQNLVRELSIGLVNTLHFGELGLI